MIRPACSEGNTKSELYALRRGGVCVPMTGARADSALPPNKRMNLTFIRCAP